MSSRYYEAALAALEAGISVVPPRMDGTKAPIGAWKEYQRRLPTVDELSNWYLDPRVTGLGAVCGEVSGWLELLEFDSRAAWDTFKLRAEETGMIELLARICNGYAEESPNGFHLLYRCASVSGNQKLARDATGKTIIETRGEGGYVILAPSDGDVHPDGAYVLRAGGFGSIEHLTEDERGALLALASTFDESARVEYVGPAAGSDVDGRPGDEYAARTTWAELLEPHGWTHVPMNGVDGWRRPGKTIGISATTGHNGYDLLYVFSTNTPFDANHGYTRFTAFTILEHGGDFRAATRDLVARGYGARTESPTTVDTRDTVSDHLKPPNRAGLEITVEELREARLSPTCIVEDHTYADVAQVVAPGGTGKTTMLLYEAVCIALGHPVWGYEVRTPGWTLFITAEDQREQLVARLREICLANGLTDDELVTVMQSVLIWDVTGRDLGLVTMVGSVVTLTTMADSVVEAHRADPPVQVIFDPMVSFGASEGAVNDNEQGLVTAARRIVRDLGCCVRMIHHTGKGNAREKTLDQYSGRGGSALADGSRMTTVLQSYNESDESSLSPPHDLIIDEGSSVIVVARPKLSYAPPNLPNIWVKRTGFMFEHVVESAPDFEADLRRNANKLAEFLINEHGNEHYHSRRSLEGLSAKIRMSRTNVRAALCELESSGRVVEIDLPKDKRRGRRQTFLCPAHLVPTSDQEE